MTLALTEGARVGGRRRRSVASPWILACAAIAAGCADDDLARGARYLEEASYRREALERSLVRPEAGYAALRLERYGHEWETRAIWNPPVRPLTVDDVGRFVDAPERASAGAMAPVLEGELEWSEAALLALGERAFETYPIQLAPSVGAATDTHASIERYGLWIDDRDRVGGLVRVALTDGTEAFAVTCATCHARVDARGQLVHGATNHRFDWGAIQHREGLRAGRAEGALAHLLEWGPGQLDVTPDAMDNPAAIPDLRAVRHQRYLHWAGTIENDLVALAIRIETLVVTSMRESVRPPREVAFALAYYLWRLGDGRRPGDAGAEPEGAALFERHCASCHAADGGLARDRVGVDDVGTDPAVGRSSTRGTGYYRVPSLWAVGERTQLLHDGHVDSLERLLDRARLDEVPGHPYGLTLDDDERAALLRFVRTIGAR